MAEWMDITRGIVLPRHCDHYGHMNVRYYAEFFDNAGFHMLNLAGISLDELKERGLGTVAANLSIDFLHEIRAGQLTLIRGAFTRLGNKSFAHELRLFSADDMVHSATQRTVEVFFDLTARASVSAPEDLRGRIEALVIEPEGE